MTHHETRATFDGGRGRLRLLVIAMSSSVAVACPVDERALQPIQVVPTTGGSSGNNASGAGEAGASGDAGQGDGGAEAGGGGTSGSSASGGSANAGSAGKGGSSGSGGSSSPAGGNAGKAGSAGVCGTGGVPEQPCPDLDVNGVLDCEETLAQNATFDANADAWQADPSVATGWENADAHDNEDSGALALENQNEDDRDGGTILGVRQCLEATAGVFYRVAVEVSVPETAPATQGGFQLIVYDEPACAGSIVTSVSSNLVRGSGWNATELTYPAPAETQSIALRLISAKPYREPPVEILFDNVLVRTD